MLSHHLSTTIFNIDEVQRRHNQRICFSFFIIICRVFVLSWSSHTFYSKKQLPTLTHNTDTQWPQNTVKDEKKLKMNVITDTYINLLSDWVIMIITCVCYVVYLLLWFVCVKIIIKIIIIMMKKGKDDDDDEQHGWSW